MTPCSPQVTLEGCLVGGAAMVVAAATTVPFAHLWEMGRRTIWAPALLHTTIDSFKLVVLPPGATVTFSLVLAAVSATVPFLVLAVPRTVRSQNRRPR